jgi:tetratricopeptide (TPR) repeat protein
MGGEPTIHPLFVDICTELTKYNQLFFVTNNSMSFDRLEKFISSVNKDNIFNIGCSLQAVDETGGRFDAFVKRIELLKEKGFPCSVSYVACPDRLEKITLYKSVFDKLKVRFVITPMIGSMNGRNYPADYTVEEKNILNDFNSNNVQTRYFTKRGGPPIPYGKLCGYINIDGETGIVTLCGWGEPLGNIYESNIDLKKIWRICSYNTCSCPHVPWSNDIRNFLFLSHESGNISPEEQLAEYTKIADNPFFDGINLNPFTTEEKKKTIEILERAEQNDKMFTEAYILRGNLYRDAGEHKAALNSYQKAVRSASVDEQLVLTDKVIKKMNDDIERMDRRLSSIINTYAQRDIKELADEELFLISELFSEGWYLEKYCDVAEVGGDPIKHYLEHGWKEERDPSPLFSTVFYLDTNPDVKAAGINPLVHYLRWGKNEGRKIMPLSVK